MTDSKCIQTMLGSRGFVIWKNAYSLILPDCSELLITDAEGERLPTDSTQRLLVGIYDTGISGFAGGAGVVREIAASDLPIILNELIG